jgi:chemotaxis protein MotB
LCILIGKLKKLSVFDFLGKDGTMRIIKFWGFFVICASVVVINGCSPSYDDLKIRNDAQRRRIAALESEAQATKLQLDQLKRKLGTAEGQEGIEVNALQQKIAALEEDLGKKKALIASMQQQLLFGGGQLPVELSTMLEEFAEKEQMVTYDSSRGMVKFKSDLLFKSGSDAVLPAAEKAVTSLCGILNSQDAKGLDIIIAGHTDDQPIRHSRPKHPTNWHLSAHRAIAVLNIMTRSKIASERLSVRGFGEFRPAVPNKPGKKGEQQNRRVEIYIVAKGI